MVGQAVSQAVRLELGVEHVDRTAGGENLGYLPGGKVTGCQKAKPYAPSTPPRGQ